jgi:hypothetical protein
MDWESLFRRYVWSDTRTPYLVPVARLTRQQAGYELFFYALFVGVLFAAVALMALSGNLPHGGADAVSLYAFSVVCSSVLLGATRHPWAATWCSSAPLAALTYFALYGFHPNLGLPDKVLLVVLMLLWLVYARRLVAVARAWPGLSGPPEPD